MGLRFTQRDFLGLREEMVRFMSEKLGSKWNDYSESDETITLIELLAHCVSNLHFAYDNQKRETDIVTASFPRNVYAHAIRNGYKPSLFKAGKTWLNIDLRKKVDGKVTEEFASLPVSIIIPRFTQIKNQEGDICITNQEYILPAGTSHFSIEVLAGEYAFEQFTRTDINEFNYIPLSRLNIAYGTTRLRYKSEEWTSVVDVYTDARTSKIYSLEPNFIQSGVRNIIRFFTTWPNEITDSDSLTLEYIQTFGANSNYEKDTFTSYLENDLSNNTVSFDDDVFDSSGNKISSWSDIDFGFTQSKPFAYGQNFESIDVIKKSYLQSIRQTTSLVVLEDYFAFITLFGLTDFYVTDWNKNKDEFITIEYPRDIKALKAEEDDEGHSIYSPLNTTKEPYWINSVQYINSSDSITDTRKIDGREIIIFKSFDADVNDFIRFENEHWYEEWKRSSILENGNNSFSSLIPSIYLSAPDRLKNTSPVDYDLLNEAEKQIYSPKDILETKNVDNPESYGYQRFFGNYDNNIRFINTSSRLRLITEELIANIDEPTNSNYSSKLRVIGYNEDEHKTLCIRYVDLDDAYNSTNNYNTTKDFQKRVFSSYIKQNEFTSIPFEYPPSFYDQTEIVSTNIADVMFDDKNKIYQRLCIFLATEDDYNYEINEEMHVNGFKTSLKRYYGYDYIDQLNSNESLIKSSLANKINSITIKIEGIDTLFTVPKSLYYDTFCILDNSSLTDHFIEHEDEEENTIVKPFEFKHAEFISPDVVYSTIQIPSYDDVDEYLEDSHENDKNDLPILVLYKSKEDKANNTKPTPIYQKLALCFRKKALDIIPVAALADSSIVYNVDNVKLSNGAYIQEGNDIYIPTSKNIDQFSSVLSKLSTIYPSFYITKLTSESSPSSSDADVIENFDKYDHSCWYSDYRKGYKVISFIDGKPYVNTFDEFFHDDFIYDRNQLTVKPLNLHYYAELFNQTESLSSDSSELLYTEEYLVNTYSNYKNNNGVFDTSSADTITHQPGDFGFLRTGLTVKGKHKYDYRAKAANAGTENILTDITSRDEHIKNTFLIDVQTTYPKYLKFLILRTCFVNDAEYTMTHKDLNKKLLDLGVDNIIYALNKIINAKVSISYWYSDTSSSIGKQYTYSPNENKRFLACGGNSSWDETASPGKNYFRWDIVYPDVVKLYQSIQQKQGRGDSVYIIPYKRNPLDIHAHVYIQDSTPDISSVFENIWNAIVDWLGILKNIEDVKYVSEFISIIQSADGNILKVCSVNEVTYNGTYILLTPSSSTDESIYTVDTERSSVEDFYRFLKFEPSSDVTPETNLGQSLVLGTVCIRLQKQSVYETTIYQFERSGMSPGKTLAYKLRQQN